jgi:hypothetical protein
MLHLARELWGKLRKVNGRLSDSQSGDCAIVNSGLFDILEGSFWIARIAKIAEIVLLWH